MRLPLAFIAIVSGCGFEHGALPGGGDDSVSADAAMAMPTARTCRYPDQSLRLCLELDDGVVSPTITDASPNHLDPIATGLSVLMRASTDPAARTASSARVSIAETPQLDISGPITIEMWVNPDRYGSATLLQNNEQYAMLLGTYGHIGCSLAGRQVFTYSEGTIAPNKWAHVACTFDGTRVRAWIDGVSTDCALTSERISTDGDEGTKLVPNFEGGLDGIRIYAADLTNQMCTHAGKTNCQLRCP